MASADRIASLVLLLFGVFVSIRARELAYWTGSAPGPGFLPFWLGVLLACASAVMLFRPGARRTVDDPSSPSSAQDRATTIRVAVVVGLTVATAALTLVIGMVLASGLFMAATLTYLRPAHGRTNGVTAALTPAVVWLVFVRWLSVPLPAGPFGF